MKKKSQWFLYIIETDSGKYYTGITTDLERRFKEHQSGKKGAKFCRGNRPVKIVYHEKCKNRSEASKRESQVKRMSRAGKMALMG